MIFHSILFEKPEDDLIIESDQFEAPDFFIDLNLDQVVEAITAGKEEYNLKPYFYLPLKSADAIKYRHEAMQELEDDTLFEQVKSFAQKMRVMREYLARRDKLYYKYQKERWFLDAVGVYCQAVTGLAENLTRADLHSKGFLAFRQYLSSYTGSAGFTTLFAETQQLQAALASVKYSILIKSNYIRVRKYAGEPDYSAEVEQTFQKFKQGEVKDYTVQFTTSYDMNPVEAGVLELIAQLYSETFQSLDRYYDKNAGYLDETTGLFDREIQFYIAYLEYLGRFKLIGLQFCYPKISDESKTVYAYETFDLALATKLVAQKSPIVCNDFYLKGQERIFVVSGPNQGGKTTFARTFGQLHYLSSLGCLVPAREAQLFLFDRLFTHFEKEETITNFSGKLQEDLVRIHTILSQATPGSIIIMNEIFTSTTLQDAVFLSQKVMEKIIELDLLCVCVTFIDELSTFSEKTVSMVSTIVPGNPALRTYKVVRRPADGLSYALTIAEKYRLTYACLKERIKS
ncbi:MAG TPA: DNA mismatch repair protein MutS [Chloroflexia bacterium]|nr:DNA mismatch repair protein MutS [Chloroflexia bacterium]